ncbi:hypothetical protein SUGI_0821960 [Cryptomeria japonica]|uniref:eukaryotic translation initiation factor 4B1 n=1 Tax=Cryptomeria japonica TaxID=3369 RepID=UPI00241483A8|nr:eukaryotic translation initiation factor 4B1 [Cryptomeria japonica]GLJ40123.1 hypothetical protein SUGI_0821960 [Cryptomeria japonica]
MANTKPWGGAGAGAWAADVEREAEEKEQRAAAAAMAPDAQDYPSLSEAISTKPKKKTKGHTLTLSELQSGQNVGLGARSRGGGVTETKGLTTEEMMSLPTGPRERTAEEESQYGRGGIGGGFRDYGRGSRFENRDRGDRGDRGSRGYGGFDDERRQGSDRDMPSRADEADNWGTTKKSMPPPGDQPERRRYNGDRYEGIGGGGSKADEVENWGSGKKFTPSGPPSERRSMGFGSSYRDPGLDSDRWGKKESFTDDRSERPRLSLNPRTIADPVLNHALEDGAPRSARPNPFGKARPREEVLAEKNIDARKLDGEFDSKVENKIPSRPSSSHSSRPGSADSKSEVVTKPRPKINPFGDAKPREELLAERGKDYLKMDFELEHRRVDRPETEEEIRLKEEINALKAQATETGSEQHLVNGETSEGDQRALYEEILSKEKKLELLIRDLDDKVRFVKRNNDRPISAAGRPPESFDRPRSQSGRPDAGNSFESLGRPRSRGGEGGGPDVWRSAEERRGAYGGSRDRFFSNRERSDLRRW